MIKNKVQEFFNEKFGEVRVVIHSNNFYFVGKDIAEKLGYVNATKAVSTHCKGVSKMGIPSNGGEQQMSVIPESDVFRLIIKSKLPDAEEFEKWVMEEILPAMRKDGAYIQDEEKVSNGEMSEDEFILKAMNILQNKVTRLTQENKELKDENAGMKPKVTKWSQFLDSESTYSFVDTCKMISTMAEQEESEIKISASKLTEFLREEGILCKTKTPDKAKADGKVKKGSYKNLPNKDYESYFDVVSIDTGKFKKVQARVKPSGIEYIYDLLKSKQAS
jgi:prophage antirepressor-like protein